MGNNVVLLGGSNSVMTIGLQKGIREEIEKLNKNRAEYEKLVFYNFALGATTHIQNLYELKRERNQEIVKNAELIITESNVNDIIANGSGFDNKEKLSFDLIYRNLNWYYTELLALNKKVLVIILPIRFWNASIINALHKKLALKYGFNCIDMQEYVDGYQLNKFVESIDWAHMLRAIMREFGRNIIKGLSNFKISNVKIKNDNPRFVICEAKDLQVISGTLDKKIVKNSLCNETVYRLKEWENILKFNQNFKDFILIGIQTWNTHEASILTDYDAQINYSSIEISNRKQCLIKEVNSLNIVIEFHNFFQIDNKTFIKVNHDSQGVKEFYHNARSWVKDAKKLPFCDLIAFFLATPDGNYYEESVDFEALGNEIITIPKEYYHNSVIPPIETYKEIIEEYCLIMDPRKLKPLQDQINQLQKNITTLTNEKTKLQHSLNSLPTKKQNLEIQNFEEELKIKKLQIKKLSKDLKLKINLDDLAPKTLVIDNNTAKSRIHNHLSYKLGNAMIRNSKSLLGYIKMPFVLWAINVAHNQQRQANQSLKFPLLESYPDYKEALKEKECFTYKLGEALIKANNTSFISGGGGYIKLLFDILKLKKEFEAKRRKSKKC
ncbi:glycosyl transferase [Helicobacter winghamensis]|uniref:glycosyl transferase n=1 Tax=Helicobacter winghamensis TaxID=157268 RepID=UPI00351B8805